MIKTVHALRRLPSLSLKEFHRYWLETHASLVKRHAAALNVVRYVQFHTIDDPFNEIVRESRAAMEPYDGISELWWKDREALARASSSPEGRRALEEILKDERCFIDHQYSSLWLAKEEVIISGGSEKIVAKKESSIVKLVFVLRRLPNLSLEEFHRYWLETHAPLVKHHAEAILVLRYVQAHTIEDPLSEMLRTFRATVEPYDGVAELWRENGKALAAVSVTLEGQRARGELIEDEKRFIDLKRSSLWLTQEHVIIER